MPHSLLVNKAYVLIFLNLDLASHQQVLENTGLTLATLEGMDTVTMPAALQIVRNMARYSSNPNWAAIYGAHLGIASHGPVGYAALGAPTVGKALTTFVEWFKVRADTYSKNIIEQDEQVEIIITDTTGDALFEEFYFEAFMRAFEVLIELLIGHPPTHEIELHFKTKASNRQALMKQEYGARLLFGCPCNKLVIPKNIWLQASPLNDPDSHEFNIRKCQQLLEELDSENQIDLTVRRLIREQFEKNIVITSDLLPPPTQLEIGNFIHLTERTLIRHLKDCNTSYKLILKEERQEYAQRLLKNVRYTIYNVSEILGYEESANFCRAFKTWTGKTPTQYRRSSEF